MGFAANKTFLASMLALALIAGYAGAARSMPWMDGAAASTPPSNAPNNGPDYFSQHFGTEALNASVRDAVMQAHLAPVSFSRIVVHTRDQLTATGQANPTLYTVTTVLENAGHGLVRRMASVQDQGNVTVTRFDLTYRGYVPFLTQTIPANPDKLPPVVEARKIMHFDTNTDGHMNFTYLYGPTGGSTFADPGQVICDSGTAYSASQLYPGIDGQALELNCQLVDANGIVTDKMKLAYLEKYDVALMLHLQNPENALDSSIIDIKVE